MNAGIVSPAQGLELGVPLSQNATHPASSAGQAFAGQALWRWRPGLLVRRERCKLLVAPARARSELLGRCGRAPFLQDSRDIGIAIDLDARWIGLQPFVESGVTGAVVRDAPGRIQLDG